MGSGPNGLAAAIVLARAGYLVTVLEGAETAGGGLRSAELTLPGFVHDVCSAVHPLALASPLLRGLPLGAYGLDLVHAETPLAHPLDGERPVLLERSVNETALSVGLPDTDAYRRIMGPLARSAGAVLEDALAPPVHVPRHPLALARFGMRGIRSASALAGAMFDGARGRALLAGAAGHSMLPLDVPLTGGFGLLLSMAGHRFGWPVAKGGSQRIADALVACLRVLGGEVVTGHRVSSVDELDGAGAVVLDVTPKQVLALAGHRLPDRYRHWLSCYRYGPGVFKMDWALDGPVPWRSPECAGAGTLHLGGTFEEVAASEAAVVAGRVPERPFVLFSQPTVCDPSRAPSGKHTAWAYCHVPAGCDVDMTSRIEAQVERFAPGFRDLVLARSAMGPAQMQAHNPNYVGGDINGGVQDLRQVLARPVPRPVPYATPDPRLFLASSSTPPGGGVHGMCGYHAARAVISRRCGQRKR